MTRYLYLSLTTIFALGCLLLFSHPALARPDIDWNRMQRDLGIMEDVLCRLHEHATPAAEGLYRGPQVWGLYFENYGVVFLVEGRTFPGPAVLRPLHQSDEEEASAEHDKKRAQLEDQLKEFLGTYADAIHQLKDTDHITVVYVGKSFTWHLDVEKIALGDSSHLERMEIELSAMAEKLKKALTDRSKSWPERTWVGQPPTLRRLVQISTRPELVHFEATARKSDIVEYRRDRISEEEFRGRIVFREHAPDTPAMKKISVMAAILDRALNRTDFPGLNFSQQTIGIYREQLGALFFMDAGPALPPFRTFDPLAEKDRTTEREPRTQFKDDLIEVIGDYGYTLRTLEPEEYVIVEVRFSPADWGHRSAADRLRLQVQKKHLDAYNHGDLDLDQFRQKVDILEF